MFIWHFIIFKNEGSETLFSVSRKLFWGGGVCTLPTDCMFCTSCQQLCFDMHSWVVCPSCLLIPASGLLSPQMRRRREKTTIRARRRISSSWSPKKRRRRKRRRRSWLRKNQCRATEPPVKQNRHLNYTEERRRAKTGRTFCSNQAPWWVWVTTRIDGRLLDPTELCKISFF